MVIFDYPKSQIHYKQKPVIKYLVEKVSAKKIIEIGSWLGESTSEWAKAVINKDGSEILSVDWYKGNPTTNLFDVAEQKDIYSIFRNNMRELGVADIIKTFVMSSTDAVKFIPDGYADIVYIDACHDYNSVKRDIELWLPKVKKGGIVSGHDYESNEYDERYIDMDVVDHKHHGVIKAVNEAFPDVNSDERIWWHIV